MLEGATGGRPGWCGRTGSLPLCESSQRGPPVAVSDSEKQGEPRLVSGALLAVRCPPLWDRRRPDPSHHGICRDPVIEDFVAGAHSERAAS